MRLRTRLFLAAFGIAGLSLLLAAALVAWLLERQLLDRITTVLVAEARLVADLVARSGPTPTVAELDGEADSLGLSLGARVTIIEPGGRVVGDTAEDGPSLAAMENHGARPEIELARTAGIGVTRRYSTTVERELLYAAVRVDHPGVAFVRLALPLTAVDDQIRVGAARHGRRVARGSRRGSRPRLDHLGGDEPARQRDRGGGAALCGGRPDAADRSVRDDEIGTVARALDASVQELGRRLAELSRNRRLTDAILASMTEGVLVVDGRGLVKMANDAVRRVLQIEETPVDRHYVELIRHPEVAKQIGRALEAAGPARRKSR